MKALHKNALDTLLEQIAYEGFASVEKWKIRRWYEQERFTIGIRRDIRDRWSRLAAELTWIADKKLSFAEVERQIIIMHDQVFFNEDD